MTAGEVQVACTWQHRHPAFAIPVFTRLHQLRLVALKEH